MVVVSRMLEISRLLTKQLQSSTFDVVTSNENVTLLYVALRRLRYEIDPNHNEWLDEAVQLADSVNCLPSKPRTSQKQINRVNTPAESPSQYYKRSVTLPFWIT